MIKLLTFFLFVFLIQFGCTTQIVEKDYLFCEFPINLSSDLGLGELKCLSKYFQSSKNISSKEVVANDYKEFIYLNSFDIGFNGYILNKARNCSEYLSPDYFSLTLEIIHCSKILDAHLEDNYSWEYIDEVFSKSLKTKRDSFLLCKIKFLEDSDFEGFISDCSKLGLLEDCGYAVNEIHKIINEFEDEKISDFVQPQIYSLCERSFLIEEIRGLYLNKDYNKIFAKSNNIVSANYFDHLISDYFLMLAGIETNRFELSKQSIDELELYFKDTKLLFDFEYSLYDTFKKYNLSQLFYSNQMSAFYEKLRKSDKGRFINVNRHDYSDRLIDIIYQMNLKYKGVSMEADNLRDILNKEFGDLLK